MDERDAEAARKVHDALEQRGFVRDWSSPGQRLYTGLLDHTTLKIPVSIEVADLDFVRSPIIRLDPSYEGRRLPHVVGANRAVCYFAGGAVIHDRYDPGGTVLRCLEQADKVVRDAIRGRSSGDFADEFHAYWEGTFLLVDLPPDFEGPSQIRFLQLHAEGKSTPVLSTKRSWLIDMAHRRFREGDAEPCLVVRRDRPLTLDPDGAWPPRTLRDLNDWFTWAAPELVGQLERSFADGEGTARSIAIAAPNGMFLCRAAVPGHLRKPEFLKARRHQLPRRLQEVAGSIVIERSYGVRADTNFIFRRNMGMKTNLTGKRVLLIGCGTIGGYLAQQLAQSGAGAEGGVLTLADHGRLETPNLGRHLLGMPYLLRNKAEACADFLRQQLPPLSIMTYTGDACDLITGRPGFDLIVDATGEEAFSIALNERAVRGRPHWPPVIFTYLIGNGALAQALLTGDPERACLKCLKRELGGEPRFRSLRPDAVTETITNQSCGDATYVPFPASRPAAAAALACDLALDWVNGSGGNRMRSILFDPEQVFPVKDGSPGPTERCPACQATS